MEQADIAVSPVEDGSWSLTAWIKMPRKRVRLGRQHDGEWHHAAVVVAEGKRPKLYIDGDRRRIGAMKLARLIVTPYRQVVLQSNPAAYWPWLPAAGGFFPGRVDADAQSPTA